MNYQEVLDYMYGSLPMFHRVGAAALKPGLENTLALCKAVGNPHHNFKTIHIAGTNGKGSSSHMLSAILQSAGFKTGLYTSPHLKNFTERIKINGQEIEEAFVTTFVNHHLDDFEIVKPSFFEMTVALAFKYFESQQVDVAVIEVGLGGRLDSTNIITPEACLITNISWDHQALLGNTLLKIASEKAGIIKPHIPVVISESQTELVDYFQDFANKRNAPITFADQQWEVKNANPQGDFLEINIYENDQLAFSKLRCELTGQYQLRNILGVLEMCKQLSKIGFNISNNHIHQGLEHTIALTNLKGRWQTLQKNPRVICDVAHNEAGIQQVISQLSSLPYDRLYWVFGAVSDKDIDKILGLLPKDCYYYFCQAQIPRALEVSVLYETAMKHHLKGEVIKDVKEALKKAISLARSEDLVMVGGSTFVVAEVVE